MTDESDDEAAIRTLVETWMAASKAGDVATVLDLMTDDVVFMVPGREPFGKQAFVAASDAMKNMRIDGNAEIRELKVLGDWAYMRNHLEMTITPERGAPVKRSGWTLTNSAQGGWAVAVGKGCEFARLIDGRHFEERRAKSAIADFETKRRSNPGPVPQSSKRLPLDCFASLAMTFAFI